MLQKGNSNTTPMTTHENTPEVVESWGKDLLNRFYALYEWGRNKGAPQSFIDFFEARTFLYNEVASQKQKQIEEIVGIAEGMKQEEHSHKVCENFSDCEMFTRHTRSHNQALDDFIIKIQAKQ